MSNQLTNNTWQPTTERYVAYFDIMGFKNMVARKSSLEIHKMLLQFSRTIDEIISDFGPVQFGMGLEHGTFELGEDLNKWVYVTKFSDSIVVFSKDKSNTSLRVIVNLVAQFQYTLFLHGLPFKGSIAFGEITCDIENLIFFGQPFIDAYELEKEIEFYGIMCHHSFDKNVALNPEILSFVQNRICKLKTGMTKNNIIVPLGFENNGPVYNEQMKYVVKMKIKEMIYSASGGLRKYIENTLELLKVV